MSEPDAQPRVDPEHPWPALLSFREDDQQYFGGREEEVEALYRRIAAGRLTLLFGLSGLGKSSLLRAGLFPRLRRERYFPVYIRLRYGRDLPPPVEQIKAEIVRQARESRVEAPEPRPGETLWEYFHRADADFWDERNYPCIPVLVFDQFEELFTKGREVAERANEVIEELANLAEGASPDLLRDSDRSLLRQVFDERYRLLIGIRSDYLAQLQSVSDRVRAVFANRYELHRMSGAAALKSTLTAGGHLMDEEVARRVVRFVAGARDGGDESSVQGLEVEPALLSLVCSELNATRLANGEAAITASMLSGSKDEILSRFYETSFADVAPALRELVEDKLVTRDGKGRNFISEQTAQETPDVSEEDLGKLVQRRLLRFEESGSSRRMELTHDLLTTVAAASRATREQRRQLEDAERLRVEAEQQVAEAERKLRRSRATVVLFLFLLALAVAGPFIAAHWTATGAKRVEADSAFRLALHKLSSDEEQHEGLAYLAHVIRLDQGNEAARTLLYEQLVTRAWPVAVRQFGPQGRIADAVFSDDGARVVFRVGQVLEMWDVAKEQRIGRLDAGYVRGIVFASDGRTLLLDRGAIGGKPGRPVLWNPQKGPPVTHADLDRLPGLEACGAYLRSYDSSANGEELAVDCGPGLMVVSLRGQPASDNYGVSTDGRFGPDPRYVVLHMGADRIIDRRSPMREVILPRTGQDFVGGFSPDGKRALIVRGDSVEVVDLESGTRVAGFDNQSPARSAMFDRSGETILTVAADECIRVWNAADGTRKFEPLWHGQIRSGAFSNDGSLILSESNGLARWWSATTGVQLAAPVVHPKIVAAHLDPGGNIVTVSNAARVWQRASAVLSPLGLEASDDLHWLSSDRKIALVTGNGAHFGLELDSGKRVWTVPEEMTAVAVQPQGTRMLVTEKQDRISVREVGTWRALWQSAAGDEIYGGKFSDDGTVLILQKTKVVQLLSAANGTPLAPPIDAPHGTLQGASRDASMLAFQSEGAIRIWDVRKRRMARTIPAGEEISMSFSPDGRQLAVVSAARLRVWNLAANREPVQLLEDGDDVYRAVFSPDGKHLAVLSENGVVLCDARTLDCSDEKLAHPDAILVDFSADGKRLLTATPEDVRVWDLDSRQPLTFSLPRLRDTPVWLSPDGTLLIAMTGEEIYRVPLPSIDDDDAERLAELGEALAGVRVERLGVTKPVEGSELLSTLGERCKDVQTPACGIVRWLRTPPEIRTISPVSDMTPAEYAKRHE